VCERAHLERRRAFTLIELLLIVAIIGLLMSILLPALGAARSKARLTACASNLRQIGIALQSYLNASNDVLPLASDMPSVSALPLSDPNNPIFIADVLSDEVRAQGRVFQCPDDRGMIDRGEPNYSKPYFATERSSYAYATRLNGWTIEDYANHMKESLGLQLRINSIWLFCDYNNFHGAGGAPGARRYLYIDGHVSDLEPRF
jgi:type II secretory pathway pseudopilin PulG